MAQQDEADVESRDIFAVDRVGRFPFRPICVASE
jgi:hypothetical protein